MRLSPAVGGIRPPLRWQCCPARGPPQPDGHGPVPTRSSARSTAERVIVAGIPKPVDLRLTDEAKIVVTTSPSPSTIGPPELPERTRPRTEVIRLWTGPLP